MVEWRLERAAEVVEPCLERRPRNPVVYCIHFRPAGMTTRLFVLVSSDPGDAWFRSTGFVRLAFEETGEMEAKIVQIDQIASVFDNI